MTAAGKAAGQGSEKTVDGMAFREDRQPNPVRSQFERKRRLRYIASSAAPASNRASVPGSGTVETDRAATTEPFTGEAAAEGSKMNVPPAPTVKLDP